MKRKQVRGTKSRRSDLGPGLGWGICPPLAMARGEKRKGSSGQGDRGAQRGWCLFASLPITFLANNKTLLMRATMPALDNLALPQFATTTFRLSIMKLKWEIESCLWENSNSQILERSFTKTEIKNRTNIGRNPLVESTRGINLRLMQIWFLIRNLMIKIYAKLYISGQLPRSNGNENDINNIYKVVEIITQIARETRNEAKMLSKVEHDS